MTSRRFVYLLSFVGVLGLVIVLGGGFGSADDDDDEGRRFNLAGTWLGSIEGQLIRLTAIPLDPTNRRVSLQLENLTADPNLGGLVEQILGIGVTRRSEFWGEAVRTGPRSFDFTIVAYGINEDVIGDDGKFIHVFTELTSGSIDFIDRNTIERMLNVAYFLPSSDPYTDPPFSCDGPLTSILERVPVVPPCDL